MQYPHEFISVHEVPPRETQCFQHVVDTYVSETNKLGTVWSELRDYQLDVTWSGADPTQTLDAVRRAQR